MNEASLEPSDAMTPIIDNGPAGAERGPMDLSVSEVLTEAGISVPFRKQQTSQVQRPLRPLGKNQAPHWGKSMSLMRSSSIAAYEAAHVQVEGATSAVLPKTLSAGEAPSMQVPDGSPSRTLSAGNTPQQEREREREASSPPLQPQETYRPPMFGKMQTLRGSPRRSILRSQSVVSAMMTSAEAGVNGPMSPAGRAGASVRDEAEQVVLHLPGLVRSQASTKDTGSCSPGYSSDGASGGDSPCSFGTGRSIPLQQGSNATGTLNPQRVMTPERQLSLNMLRTMGQVSAQAGSKASPSRMARSALATSDAQPSMADDSWSASGPSILSSQAGAQISDNPQQSSLAGNVEEDLYGDDAVGNTEASGTSHGAALAAGAQQEEDKEEDLYGDGPDPQEPPSFGGRAMSVGMPGVPHRTPRRAPVVLTSAPSAAPLKLSRASRQMSLPVGYSLDAVPVHQEDASAGVEPEVSWGKQRTGAWASPGMRRVRPQASRPCKPQALSPPQPNLTLSTLGTGAPKPGAAHETLHWPVPPTAMRRALGSPAPRLGRLQASALALDPATEEQGAAVYPRLSKESRQTSMPLDTFESGGRAVMKDSGRRRSLPMNPLPEDDELAGMPPEVLAPPPLRLTRESRQLSMPPQNLNPENDWGKTDLGHWTIKRGAVPPPASALPEASMTTLLVSLSDSTGTPAAGLRSLRDSRQMSLPTGFNLGPEDWGKHEEGTWTVKKREPRTSLARERVSRKNSFGLERIVEATS